MAFDYNNYYKLEYIESSGTQYIETNVLVNETTNIEIKCIFTKLFDYNMAVGVWSCLSASTTSTGNACISANGVADNNISTYQLGLNTIYEIRLGPMFSGANVNGTEVFSSNVNNVVSTTATISIFAAKDNSTVNNTGSNVPMAEYWGGSYGYVKVFYCKLYIGDTLIRSFVPAKRKSDNVLGLYDEVNGVFYTNAGTGTFIEGPTILVIPSLVDLESGIVNYHIMYACTNTLSVGDDYFGWKVLAIENGRALLISDKVLDTMKPYTSATSDNYSTYNYSWLDCDINSYLNSTFIEESTYNDFNHFDIASVKHITETYTFADSNSEGVASVTTTSNEKIFLLSVDEVNKYFADDTARIAYNSSGLAVSWWLRSPGSLRSCYTAVITESGAIGTGGSDINQSFGIRPAFWCNYTGWSYYLVSQPSAIGFTSQSSSADTVAIPVCNGKQTWTGTKNTFTVANSTCSGLDGESNPLDGAVRVAGLVEDIPAGVGVAKTVVGDSVYNAVWNDLVDCIEVPNNVNLEYGYAYSTDGTNFYKTKSYLDCGYIGIHSDTAGFIMGDKGKYRNQLKAAVAGFVLAYVDKEYPCGTPLTCTENGYLTKLKDEDIEKNPHLLVGTYWKNEPFEYWGFDKGITDNLLIEVKGRKWIKVK